MPSYHNPAGLSGHIMNIWTDPAFRGRGIAWRMLDLLTAAACERGCLTVSLHTTAMGREATGADGVQCIGTKFVLYRQSSDPDKRKIVLEK